jgi:hypothetical protein
MGTSRIQQCSFEWQARGSCSILPSLLLSTDELVMIDEHVVAVVDQESGGSAAPATSFALAKLTNRLNFLKERRALLASEMQNLDLGRPPAAAAAPSAKSPSPKGPEKRKT